jgi:hypothetical protein
LWTSWKPLVSCIDVLEHIESEYLEEVISQLEKLTTHVGIFSVHTGPARKVLADGRNAHLIQQPASWGLQKLIPHFDIIQLTPGQARILGHRAAQGDGSRSLV